MTDSTKNKKCPTCLGTATTGKPYNPRSGVPEPCPRCKGTGNQPESKSDTPKLTSNSWYFDGTITNLRGYINREAPNLTPRVLEMLQTAVDNLEANIIGDDYWSDPEPNQAETDSQPPEGYCQRCAGNGLVSNGLGPRSGNHICEVCRGHGRTDVILKDDTGPDFSLAKYDHPKCPIAGCYDKDPVRYADENVLADHLKYHHPETHEHTNECYDGMSRICDYFETHELETQQVRTHEHVYRCQDCDEIAYPYESVRKEFDHIYEASLCDCHTKEHQVCDKCQIIRPFLCHATSLTIGEEYLTAALPPQEEPKPAKGTDAILPTPNRELEDLVGSLVRYEKPYNCARCGATTDDKSQDFCWCTDRDTSTRFPEPNWINNLSYPRQLKEIEEARSQLSSMLEEEAHQARIGLLEYMLTCDRDNKEAGHKWSSGDWRKFVEAELMELTKETS